MTGGRHAARCANEPRRPHAGPGDRRRLRRIRRHDLDGPAGPQGRVPEGAGRGPEGGRTGAVRLDPGRDPRRRDRDPGGPRPESLAARARRSEDRPRGVGAQAGRRRARAASRPPGTVRGTRTQVVAAAPPPPEGYARYRAYNYGPGYGYGYAPGYASGYTDDRLDRLSSAQAAGYVVVHRRTVQFPDGRTLRVYRPDDEGEPF
ncbi:hypothetical protein [Methylobacterium sp. C1]|uniref:hypothetical protein n=1 Tax=Methylobacterium sp. C1 TaxID=1479019 RepID=UPI000A8E746F|nr:hypothetical protein [Methylobacterium sp. C1]